MIEKYPEDDWPESNEAGNISRRVWLGLGKLLPQTIAPGAYQVTKTMGGRIIAVLDFADGAQAYNLRETPVFIEHTPYLQPEQGNLQAAWFTADQLKSDFLIPHEIHPDRNSDHLCRDVFLASRKLSFLEKIKLIITQNYLRPLADKLRRYEPGI